MHHSSQRIYFSYFRLGDTAYRDKVRYYEENREAISALHYEEKFDVDADYLLCLFEIGRYERYLQKADALIEQVITDNIYQYRGENIFNELLFRKAACCYHLGKYNECTGLLRQLMRMDNENTLYSGLYIICKRRMGNDFYELVKASAMASFLLILGITVASILSPPPLRDYIGLFTGIRLGLLVYAATSLLAIEVYFQYRMYRETGMVSHKILRKIFG